MANHLTNDRGQSVMAIGAPASVERVKVEFPALIDRLNSLYFQAYESPGRAVDEAVGMIRAAGVTATLETRSILAASHYGDEPTGSVSAMVMAV